MDNKQRKQFLELYLNGNQKSAIDFAKNHRPQYIYKYCSFDKKGKNLENIQNDCVYLCSPSKFNDPYDCKIHLNKNEIKPNLKLGISYEEFINDIQKSNKISCFSEFKDNLIMWAHYAKKHQGFCIQYNISDINPILNIPEEDSSMSVGLFPVIYQENLLDFTEEFIDIMKTPKPYTGALSAFISVLVKYNQWEYEQEWRLIAINIKSDDGQYSPPIKPSAIYLGTKIKPENKIAIKEIAKEKSIPVFKMEFSNKAEYKLYQKRIQ